MYEKAIWLDTRFSKVGSLQTRQHVITLPSTFHPRSPLILNTVKAINGFFSGFTVVVLWRYPES